MDLIRRFLGGPLRQTPTVAGMLLTQVRDDRGPADPNCASEAGRSVLNHPDPLALLRRASGNGQSVSGRWHEPGYKERFDFGEVIGYYMMNGRPVATTRGIIHHSWRKT